MTDLLSELEAIARAATQGPWGKIGVPYYEYWIVPKGQENVTGRPVDRIAMIRSEGDPASPDYDCDERRANAAHIVAFDPPTVLKVLAVARAAVDVADRNRPPREVTNDFNTLRAALAALRADQA